MARTILLALVLLMPGALLAQQPSDAERTITVTATGTVEREPEQAVVTLAVETLAPTADEASAQNAEQTEALIDALEALGISDDLIRTVGYGLHPEYDREARPESGEPRIVGYRAVNRVRITIDPVTRTGAVIDAGIEAGANRVQGIAFQLRDPEAARIDALQEALDRARTEAEALAAAAAQRLGLLLAVSTGGRPPVPVAYDMEMARATFQRSVTPIEPGTMEVSATVTVVYALEPQ